LIATIFVYGRERLTRIPDLVGASTINHARKGLRQCHTKEAVGAALLGKGCAFIGVVHQVLLLEDQGNKAA
jgi:hypothetical protein